MAKRSARNRMAGSPRAFRQAALLGFVEIPCGMGRRMAVSHELASALQDGPG